MVCGKGIEDPSMSGGWGRALTHLQMAAAAGEKFQEKSDWMRSVTMRRRGMTDRPFLKIGGGGLGSFLNFRLS